MLRVRSDARHSGGKRAASRTDGSHMTWAERLIARCVPSAGDFVFVSVLVGMLLGKQGLLLDGDSAWNLRIGGAILDHGLPRTEFLLGTSYGRPEVYWEWLAQAIYAGALRLGGLNAVAALASLLVALTALSLYSLLRRRGVPLLASLGLTYTAVFVTTIGWTARAQLFSLPLLLWWTEWLWRYWRDGDRKRLWAFPAVVIVWVNLHPGVVEGLLELGVAVAIAWFFPNGRGKADPRALTVALVGAIAATTATPWGPGLDAHLLATATNPVIAHAVNEYQSPSFHDPYALVFLALGFALVAAWMRAGHALPQTEQLARWPVVARQPEPLAVALVAVWTALALYSLRFVPLWAVVVVPILAEALGLRRVALSEPQPDAPALQRLARRLRMTMRRLDATDQLVGRGVWGVITLCCLLVVLTAGGTVPGTDMRLISTTYNAQTFPVSAATLLRQRTIPAGRGFTTDLWGSYLEYALPDYRPFVDTRQDVESPQLLRDYMTVMNGGPDWQHVLDAYQVRWALLPRGSAVAQLLALTPGWRCSPADKTGVATLCLRTG